MLANAILTSKLNTQLKQGRPTPAHLEACCKILLENYKFDCVFLASAPTPEESPVPLACHGKEEIMDACLYRLGAEDRVALTKVPLKTYQDITGKPVFNKSGSLRIQKPYSGVIMVLNAPKKVCILLGFAHLNAQPYPPALLEELPNLWREWGEALEKAVVQVTSPGRMPDPAPVRHDDPPPLRHQEPLPPLDEDPLPEAPMNLDRLSFDPLPNQAPAAPVALPPKKSSLFIKPSTASGQAPAPPPAKSPETRKESRRPLILVDEVTRLYNKDYFAESLTVEVERAKRSSRLMSLIYLSVSPVEGMPRMNENQVANQVAEILSKSLRKVDIICRLDKSKYGLVLPDTANNTYGIIAKRIFKFFKQVMGENPPVYLNISASTFPKHAADAPALMDNAEKLLLQAQQVGPNKAVLPD